MAKKPVFLDDVEWGNIELEGFSDKQLFDPNLNHRLAMKVISEDPEWQKKNAESNRRKAQDPKWLKANRETKRNMEKTPEWRAALTVGSRLHQGRAIVTPEGQFDSIAEAVDYYWDNKILPNRTTKQSVRKFLVVKIKKEASGFYYV